MTLQELVYELNFELKSSTEVLPLKKCFEEIRKKVPSASKMTNLQLLLLTTIVSSEREFQERVSIEISEQPELEIK